jgi:hypothetical protein
MYYIKLLINNKKMKIGVSIIFTLLFLSAICKEQIKNEKSIKFKTKNSEGNIVGESFNGEARKSSPAISYGLASTSTYTQPQGVITILIS